MLVISVLGLHDVVVGVYHSQYPLVQGAVQRLSSIDYVAVKPLVERPKR